MVQGNFINVYGGYHTFAPTDSLEAVKRLFTTIPPQYEQYYRWLYRKVKHGHMLIRQFLGKLHPKNAPSEIKNLTNTPFPIPPEHCYVYEQLRDTTTTTEDPVEFQNKVDAHFSHGYPPEYAEFFRWLYRVRHDDEGLERRNIVMEYLTQITYGEFVRYTPFPVPERFANYFAYVNAIDRTIGSTDHHYWYWRTPSTRSM